jgi:DNA-binding transcriptional LysR family regulator
MEVHEIRYFVALAETLNFTRAAERCNVTQPALTRAIKSLEDRLGGGPLIHRERSNTHLTELGHMMLPYFTEMLSHMQQAKRRARELVALKRSRLTVGLMCTIGPSRLVDLFGAFNERFEGVELYLQDARAGVLEQMLEKGELDLAIYCKPDDYQDNLHRMPLYDERFVIAAAPRHRLARLERVRLKDLDGERYLSRANCEYADYIGALAAEQGVSVEQPYASERDDWIQAMVLAGLGFTMIPEYAVTMPGLVLRPLVEPEVVRNVNLISVRGRPHSAAVGAFVHEARRFDWQDRMRAAAAAASAA